ncbi:DUF1553 domain-containing protein [Lentisphaera profundi]|uniref:DUF1553 domain-containing protein n=1 Tax=Lentisphaera profundi TaxID=1658616 RepID=A0ABY7VWU1_9BACT|nr:DUF1549 domain-containing protein [Lentisphaera profundi]WDE97347.1 DUF1553 domain-containing protein [Lentisphaera profundi]
MIKLLSTFLLFSSFASFAEDIVKISVLPTKIKLTSARSCAQVLVTGYTKDGKTIDLSRKAKFTHNHFVKVENAYVTPLANGNSQITVNYGKLQQTIPFTVSSTDKNDPVSFNWETLAILTKQGCNGGGCHGKPNGRGALELSLNAFDPDFDEKNMIRGAMGRFLQPIAPEQSLLLKKPSMQVGHVGGKRLEVGSLQYELLLQWIKEGAKSDKGEKKLKTLKVFPRDRALEFPNQDQQLSVWAFFEDGTFRDVTRIATYTTSHKRVAIVNDKGLVSGLDRGQSAISVRYIDDVVTVNFTMVKKIDGFKWKAPKENNYIDTLVNNKLRQLQYLPAGTIDDSTFIRRLSLDLRGQVPKIEEVNQFVSNKNPKKRSQLIDKFLDSDEFARFYAMKTADLLKINTHELKAENAANYSRWIYEATKANMPFDKFTEELLMSQGHTDVNPKANFFRTTKDSKMVTESVTQLFMGSRLTCAQCHNHPYESWTQDNYYQITSAFNNIDRKTLAQEKGNEPNRKTILIYANSVRNTANPRTKITQDPWPIDVQRDSKDDPRKAFVQWLTAKDNPYFANTEVNRIWSYLLGRGIVMPVDDFRPSNPATNKELLAALARDFSDSNYNRKHIFRQILNSQTYQRTTETNDFNKNDSELFSHARPRLLGAEQVKDAILLLCDAPKPEKFQSDKMAANKKRSEIIKLKDELNKKFPAWLKQSKEPINWTELKTSQVTYAIKSEGLSESKPKGFILSPKNKEPKNSKKDRLGLSRTYHPLTAGNISAINYKFAKNDLGQYGNGLDSKLGISLLNAWLISQNKGSMVKSIEITANSDSNIAEVEVLMDGKNIINKAKITQAKSAKVLTSLSDGKLNPAKSANHIKIEFPQETPVQFLTLHRYNQATIKFFDKNAKVIHQVKVNRKGRFNLFTTALPVVKKIDIKGFHYWEDDGEKSVGKKVSLDGKWTPINGNNEPHLSFTFKPFKSHNGQSLVIEHHHLDKNEGLIAKYKVQMNGSPSAHAQVSLDFDTLKMARNYTESDDWKRELVKYSYYQLSPEYKALKQDWEKRQAKLDKVFATQKLYPENSKFLTAFGQPERKTVCACERPESVALDQSLQLMNGEYVKEKLQNVKYNSKLGDAENIKQLYLSAYSRNPKSNELQIATDHLKKSSNKDEAMRDLYWVVINSNEFIFQH